MKKLILLAAFIISVNSFAGISLTGGTSGSWSAITNASGGKDLSGNFAFTNSGTSKINSFRNSNTTSSRREIRNI